MVTSGPSFMVTMVNWILWIVKAKTRSYLSDRLYLSYHQPKRSEVTRRQGMEDEMGKGSIKLGKTDRSTQDIIIGRRELEMHILNNNP